MKVRVLAASVFLAGLVLLALLEPASGLVTSAQAWPVIGATSYSAPSDPSFGGEPSCEREGGNVEVVGWLGGYARALALQGKYGYVGAGARLKVVDVSNHARPTTVGQSAFLPDLVQGVAVADRYAYLADGEGGLRVVDVDDPASPTLAGFLEMPEDARGIALAGDYAYVATGEGGLRIIDISSPVSPTLASFLDTPGEAYGVVVSGTYAFVAGVA